MDTIKNFLLKIDGFIYTYYKLPTFLYFIFLLGYFNEKGYRPFLEISRWTNKEIYMTFYQDNFGSVAGLKMPSIVVAPTDQFLEYILLTFPLLIIYAWKRIFHPKD